MTEQSKRAAQHAEEKMFLELEEECARLHAEIERLRALDDQRETEHVALAGEIARLREDQSLLREIVAERQEEIAHLRDQRYQLLAALKAVRSKGIVAGAAFVRRNDDGPARCTEVLDIIDAAIAAVEEKP